MRLEPCAAKVASTVLRGGSDSNVTSLPDSACACFYHAQRMPTAKFRFDAPALYAERERLCEISTLVSTKKLLPPPLPRKRCEVNDHCSDKDNRENGEER